MGKSYRALYFFFSRAILALLQHSCHDPKATVCLESLNLQEDLDFNWTILLSSSFFLHRFRLVLQSVSQLFSVSLYRKVQHSLRHVRKRDTYCLGHDMIQAKCSQVTGKQKSEGTEWGRIIIIIKIEKNWGKCVWCISYLWSQKPSPL